MRKVTVLSRFAGAALVALPLAGCYSTEVGASLEEARRNMDTLYDERQTELLQTVLADPPRSSPKLSIAELEARFLGMKNSNLMLYCKYKPSVTTLEDMTYAANLKFNTKSDLMSFFQQGNQYVFNLGVYGISANRDECAEAKRKYQEALDKLAPDILALKKMGY